MLRYDLALVVHEAEVVLGVGVALFCERFELSESSCVIPARAACPHYLYQSLC